MLSAQQFLKEFNNVESLDESLYEIVSQICEEVKLQGDKALKNYNLQFDQVETEKLELEQSQLKNAYDMLDNETRDALEQSYQRIKVYQENIKVKQESSQQTECYERYHPIERVGIYVPGGKASYPSTVLMTATLAQVAGVNEITVVTPPQNSGICQEVLAACYITGVHHVYQVGGAQSIANHHYLILAQDTEEACLIMNTIAPEHASIQTRAPEMYIDKVKYVGALFLGHFSPEVIGDYVAGPSHVLPTNQTARFTNRLSVNDFMTRHSVIHLSQKTFNEVAESAEHIAHIESLFNHEKSIHVRR